MAAVARPGTWSSACRSSAPRSSLLARALLPGDGGHPPLEGIGGGATPLAYAPGVALAALGTLAFGAVLGPRRR